MKREEAEKRIAKYLQDIREVCKAYDANINFLALFFNDNHFYFWNDSDETGCARLDYGGEITEEDDDAR